MSGAEFGADWSAGLRRGTDAELRGWLDVAQAACDEADVIARQHFRRDLQIDRKPDRTFVTQADKEIDRLRDDASLNCLERVILACDALNPLQATARLDPRIRRSLDFIAEGLERPLSINALSQEVGLSRSRFTILFSNQMGTSPQLYIENARLGRATQLLRMTGWSIAQVAERTGFSNAYYFSTRFRLRFGIPPSQFRARD